VWLANEKSEQYRHILQKIIASFGENWENADMDACFNKKR